MFISALRWDVSIVCKTPSIFVKFNSIYKFHVFFEMRILFLNKVLHLFIIFRYIFKKGCPELSRNIFLSLSVNFFFYINEFFFLILQKKTYISGNIPMKIFKTTYVPTRLAWKNYWERCMLKFFHHKYNQWLLISYETIERSS